MDDLVERLLEERVLRLDKYTKTTMRRNPEGPEAVARITALEASLAEARRQALEEAAKACEAHMSQCLDDRDIQKRWPQIKVHNAVYAGVVRALKDSPPPPTVV